MPRFTFGVDEVTGMTLISNRLLTVAEHVTPGSAVADIGSDHGMLPCHLIRVGRARRCIAVEISNGPYQACLTAVGHAGLSDDVEVRLGDGLSPLSPGEADVVCVSGMGGATIAGILARGEPVLHRVQRLVLQPNGGDGLLRRHLFNTGWELKAEKALEERGRFYAVIVAERGEPEAHYNDHPLPREVLLEAGQFKQPSTISCTVDASAFSSPFSSFSSS